MDDDILESIEQIETEWKSLGESFIAFLSGDLMRDNRRNT